MDTSILSDDDYDVVSNPGQRSLESSDADYGHVPAQVVHEPLPSRAARDKFETISWTPTDVQAYVRRTLVNGSPHRSLNLESSFKDGVTVRVYVDGLFDAFNMGHALQLRQAKLSFPSVYLMVGVFSDELLEQYGYFVSVPHIERCEVLRHCRWVDEVLPDVPWVISQATLEEYLIDYVALDEGTSVDPGCDKERLKGYDEIKAFGKVIPTRRTMNISQPAISRVVSPSLNSTLPTLQSAADESDVAVDVYGIGY